MLKTIFHLKQMYCSTQFGDSFLAGIECYAYVKLYFGAALIK